MEIIKKKMKLHEKGGRNQKRKCMEAGRQNETHMSNMLSLCAFGFWMRPYIQYERTCREWEQWAALEIMSLQHPLERRILDQRTVVGASRPQIHTYIQSLPHTHTQTNTFYLTRVCIWTVASQKHSMAHMHTHSVCEQNYHHGNWTLIAIYVCLTAHASLYLFLLPINHKSKI